MPDSPRGVRGLDAAARAGGIPEPSAGEAGRGVSVGQLLAAADDWTKQLFADAVRRGRPCTTSKSGMDWRRPN
jgi:hypothetical protein